VRLFAIDTDNTITAFPADEQVPEGQQQFASEKELAKLSADWPADRLIHVWNNFAGAVPFDDLKPVKKFTDRKTAVARIWKAIQRLDATPAPHAAAVAPKGKRSRKAATAEPQAATAREGSKKAIVLDMLRRPDGATLAEIMSATGWLAHSVRGFISGSLTKKMGLTVESLKTAEGRAYRVAAK
jgi:hypothetical protein